MIGGRGIHGLLQARQSRQLPPIQPYLDPVVAAKVDLERHALSRRDHTVQVVGDIRFLAELVRVAVTPGPTRPAQRTIGSTEVRFPFRLEFSLERPAAVRRLKRADREPGPKEHPLYPAVPLHGEFNLRSCEGLPRLDHSLAPRLATDIVRRGLALPRLFGAMDRTEDGQQACGGNGQVRDYIVGNHGVRGVQYNIRFEPPFPT